MAALAQRGFGVLDSRPRSCRSIARVREFDDDDGRVPAKLVGEWTRTVTSADVTRTGALGVPAGTVCTLTMKKSGEAGVDCGPSVGGFEGTVVPGGTNRVHINLGISSPNVYRWGVSGRLLTFTKVKDGVSDREAVVGGVWEQK